MQLDVTDTVKSIDGGGDVLMGLVLRNTGSNTIYFGWEDTTVATAGANQGVPLEADEMLAMAGRDIDVGGKLFLVCASGQTSTLNYSMRK